MRLQIQNEHWWYFSFNEILFHFWFLLGGKSARGIRVSSYDPDDPNSQSNAGNTDGGYAASKTLGNQRKFMPGSQRVATISQNYNEKTMLLSSDDEYQ